MFSIRITAESTMMPKSTAPTESRLASCPISTMTMTAKNSANGILTPTMMALRKLPRKTHWMTKTSRQPKMRLCRTVWVVTDYQRRAVVVGNDLDPRRQRAVPVHLVDFCLDEGDDVVGVIDAAHDDNRQGDVTVVILAGDAEPRHVADRNFGDVLDLNRHAVDLSEHDVLDVVDAPALRQIGVAAGVHQADAADVHRLLADGDLAAADIDVGVAERGDDLRHA